MVSYTGNGAYCYANSLHMCLKARDADYVPSTEALECMTLMPFGAHFNEHESAAEFFPSLAAHDPERGLTMAIGNLGWQCDSWSASEGQLQELALEKLRTALAGGPALLGPLDMGVLTYNPRARGTPSGADHYVVCLALEAEKVLLHDPQGYPFVTLPLVDLIESWRAERIGYAPGLYTLRWDFRQAERLSAAEVYKRTLTSLRDALTRPSVGTNVLGGAAALRRTAELLRNAEPPASLMGLHHFALPLGARRCQDGASFLNAAGLSAAAVPMACKAELYGRAQYESVRENWPSVAKAFDALAEQEEIFAAAVLA